MADAAETPEAPAEAPAETPTGTARPVQTTRGSFTRFLMIFLVLLAILTILQPGMATEFGTLTGYVLMPIIGFGGRFAVLTILLAGALTTGVSSILRDHYTDWIKMVKIQKTNAAFQREMREALRKGNRSQIEKLRKIQQGFMKDQMDVQLNTMKPLAWTFFLFIVLFAWLSVFVNNTLADTGGQYFAVPWASNVFVNYVPFWLPSWILMYSLLAIPIGQILTRVLKYVRFRKKLLAMGLPLKPQPLEPS